MHKVCLLVACIVCAGDGRRQRSNTHRFAYSRDVGRQMLVQQRKWKIPKILPNKRPPKNSIGTHAGLLHTKPVEAIPIQCPTDGFTIRKQRIPILENYVGRYASPRPSISEESDVDKSSTGSSGPRVRVAVSVDWEGDSLRESNVRAFQYFREAHPDVPLTHFLNAAYFTKSGRHVVRQWNPRDVVSPIDECGLHVHGWRSLVESSGVEYRSEPTFQDTFLDEHQTSRDQGANIDIRAYTVDELQAIIANSKRILEEQGLKVGTSFRAGAWLAGPNVLEAIRREGFLVDSSAVDSLKWLRPFHAEPLHGMLREVWPCITNESQPYLIETAGGRILEMPDTGALADYNTLPEIVEHVDNAVQKLDSEDLFVHIGFHQETAASNVWKVISAIKQIREKHGHRVVFETLEDSARRAMSVGRLMKAT